MTIRRMTTWGASLALSAAAAMAGEPAYWLTVLHNNDGESQLIHAGPKLEDFGGAARFATLVNQLKYDALLQGRGAIIVSSGDNFLAGPEFNASLSNGIPYYDALAMDLIGYDAVAIGNHEFDFGPNTLANFIGSFFRPVPWLSANLDVSNVSSLQTLADEGRIAASTIVSEQGELIGIVGATTPMLPTISSPGAVVVDPNVAAAIQAEIDALELAGVNKIILISHLQSIEEDLALAPLLRGVDIMVAGGGDELLANDGDLLLPDDTTDAIYGPYPITAQDARSQTVYVVTTKGAYRYVGRLTIGFDAAGNVIELNKLESGPVRVAGGENPDAVLADPLVQALVVDPVIAAVESLAINVIADSNVPLDGRRVAVRSRETNQGDLIADALLWQATQLAARFSAPVPDIALQNGGGIRNDSIIPPGDITELDTFDMLPFANFVSIVPNVPATQFKEILENAVSRIDPPPGFPTSGDGRFAQIAGFMFSYDADLDPGQRVIDVTLESGTRLVVDGEVLEDAPAVNIATIDFLANGGDEYPFNGASFITLGVTYQLALANYIEQALAAQITATEYPEGGEDRILRLDMLSDINNDGTTNAADLAILLGEWGTSSPDSDLNGDGMVNAADLAQLLGTWTLR